MLVTVKSIWRAKLLLDMPADEEAARTAILGSSFLHCAEAVVFRWQGPLFWPAG
jgi:hypothetical protein